MSKISEEKIKKIKEEILRVLYENNPKALYTIEIANELIRDNEFILELLLDLNKNKFVEIVNKSNTGKRYLARKRWKLSNKVFNAYNKMVD